MSIFSIEAVCNTYELISLVISFIEKSCRIIEGGGRLEQVLLS